MNLWNILHLITPFSALFYSATVLLTKEIQGNYSAAFYIGFNIFFLCLTAWPLFAVKNTKQNFVIFFPVYILWFSVAAAPHVIIDAYSAAWTCSWINVFALVAQWYIACQYEK